MVYDWLLPALNGGENYLLKHWKQQNHHYLSKNIHIALVTGKNTGSLPQRRTYSKFFLDNHLSARYNNANKPEGGMAMNRAFVNNCNYNPWYAYKGFHCRTRM